MKYGLPGVGDKIELAIEVEALKDWAVSVCA